MSDRQTSYAGTSPLEQDYYMPAELIDNAEGVYSDNTLIP